MGSPPALILANFFMGCYEKYRIEKIEVVKPTFCKRYADIFAVFKSQFDAETFCVYLNTKHKNMLFLDILISNNKNLRTSVFCDKRCTGLLFNSFSFAPDSYKSRLIICI